MNNYELLESEINSGLAGRNSGISMGFPKLSKYIGIRRRIYTLVFGGTGTGKSAFVHSAYILSPLEWYLRRGRTEGKKYKVILFSMERSKVHLLAKWLSRKIFVEEGICIQVPKMLGWWKDKLSKDEHDLVKKYKDYIGELSEIVDIIEGAQNPTGVYKYVKQYAEANGKLEQSGEYHRVYIPNHQDETIVPIIDHYGLLKYEKGLTTRKDVIDRTSEHMQMFRDLYGYSPVMVAQLNRSMSNPAYKKMDSFEPTLDDCKESGAPGEASDVAISLFKPSAYKTADEGGYAVARFTDPNTGHDHFRSLKVLKSTYSESDIRIGMVLEGATGIFKELPYRKDMDSFNYNKLFNGTFYLE